MKAGDAVTQRMRAKPDTPTFLGQAGLGIGAAALAELLQLDLLPQSADGVDTAGRVVQKALTFDAAPGAYPF